ncbi:beta strand repeat-containing protein [Anaerobiospirillum succiniciproducens]|uniref:beta strand repeat-containing protein n=1 Tax=Anaerobiospirillum succiniciproducens TaxID=13335 RepID=UPI003F8AC74C
MKQTNNAIKFLMAQYRAIFKNANIAMVAAMAAAALAAGQAQAAEGLTGELKADAKSAVDIVVASGTHNLDASKNKFAKSLTINQGASATIKSGGVTSLGDVNLNSGSLTVSGTDAGLFLGAIKAVESKDKQHYEHDLTATNRSTITLDKANIGVANFDISGSTITLTSGGAGGTNLTAYGKGAFQGDSGPEKLSYQAIGKLTDVTANLVGGTNITAIGYLDVKGTAKDKSVINLKGLTSGSETTHTKTLAYLGGSKKLTIENTTINASGTEVNTSKGAAVVSPDLKINNSKIVVAGANDTLTLGGLYDRNSAGGATVQDQDYTADKAVITGSTINVTSGTLNLGYGVDSKTSFTLTDNTIDNKGVINAYGDVTVDRVAGLYDANGTLNLSGSTLTVTGKESIDLSAANTKINADSGSKLVVENGSITIYKDFVSKVGNVNAGTIVISGVESGSAGSSNGAPSGSSSLKVGDGAHITAFNKLEGSKARSILMLDPTASKASLTLGDSAGSKGELKNIERVQIGRAATTGTSTFDVHGTWDFNNAGLYVAKNATATIHEGASITDVERLKVEDNSNTNIYGTANINRLQAEAEQGTGKVNVYGTLNIRGDGKEKDGPSSSNTYTNDVYLKKGTLNIHAGGTVALTTKDAWDDVLIDSTDENTGITTFTVSKEGNNSGDSGAWVNDKVTLNAGGTLRIDLSGYKVKDVKALETLAGQLKDSTSKGIVDFGKVSFATKLETNNDGSIDLNKMPSVKTEATQNLEVNVGSGSINGSYSIGSANVSGDSLTLESGSTLEFNNAKNGQFATNTAASGGSSSKVNVTLAANSAVNLNGNGSLGDIKKNGSDTGTAVVLGGNNGTQTVGEVQVEKFKQVGGNVTTGAITVSGDTTVNGVLNAGGNISTDTLNLVSGAINAADKVITVTSKSKEAKIFGDVEAGSLTLAGGATIAGDADVKLGTLDLAADSKLNVGRDGEDGSSAAVFTDKLVMGAGSTIFVDPEYKDKASIFATQNLTNGTGNEDTGVLSGSIFVGKNAAFGYGFDQANFDSVMANYLVDGKFTDPDAAGSTGPANALVLNKPVQIASGEGIVVDHTLTSTTVGTVPADTVKLGKNAVLIVTDNAVANGPAITLGQGATAAYTATVTADASAKVSLVGDFNAKSTNIKIFDAVTLNGQTLNKQFGEVNVEALGGLVVGKTGTNGTVASLGLSDKAQQMAYAGVSRPVGDFFLGLALGDYAVDSTQAGHKFVTAVANTAGGFKVVDTAAHAATYAGAQQAAVASVTTMADAMFGRVGAVGVEAASISATGSQANGGVWLTPMYKSMDSDGFNAEGASYGSDVDLGGVAFGADTVNGNMRFGAVFNIGSGDTEGKGQGNGLKDEFDYYGFGIYSAMGFGSFALVGDASMTVISHEVEGLGLRGKADTTAVTMGLTGQYTVATPAVDVTPHLGARFIRLNTDSYDLIGADGAIATTDFDVQNVFSVPLGVTLSKGFTTGGWTLAPSADLTVTFNAGDTEAKSTTTFSGIAHGINMNTEVLDEVQYGLTVGLGAQYGAFGTSFGINYTGSSNTDSFGVNAQARYMF